MSKPVVYIPTRGRIQNLGKVLPAWREQRFLAVVMTEPNEAKAHRKFIREHDFEDFASVLSLPRADQGIGNSRHQIIKHASSVGLRRIILADDDCKPHKDSDMRRLLKFRVSQTLGMGACFSYYGLQLGNDFIRDTNKKTLMPGGMGYNIFSLDVEATIGIGNFDRRLHTYWEDAELIRQAMKDLHIGWHIHTGVWGTQMGKRYDAGGINSLAANEARKRREKMCHQIVYKRWGPRYISHPDKRPRCSWANMLDDFVPGWREKAVWLNK